MKLSNIKTYIRRNIPECIIFVVYMILVITTMGYHEHWFDELQAYQISKDSIFNILFYVPHLEGHPPLWHLILKIFSFVGCGPEVALRIPNFIFISLAVALLIFKSPFPRCVKLFLPFTFFLFYQYAVICRPYSLMTLEIFLLAYLYKTKNEHPVRFTSVLALTCLTNPYGMFFATVVTIAWGLEIKANQNWSKFLDAFANDKKFHLMLFLFFLCIFLSLEITPMKAVNPPFSFNEVPFIQKIYYCFFILPADATIFSVLDYNNLNAPNVFSIYAQIATIWGILITVSLTSIFKKLNSLKLFILTYFGFLTFASLVYMWPHHIGLLSLIIIFCFWCAFDDKKNSSLKFQGWQKFILILTFIVQILWSATVTIKDLILPYALPKNIAKYIKVNNLDRYKIMAKFVITDFYISNTNMVSNIESIPVKERHKYKRMPLVNSNNETTGMMINAYLGKNIFFNFNTTIPEKDYILNTPANVQESIVAVKIWQDAGLPDLFILPPIDYYKPEIDNINEVLTTNVEFFPLSIIYGEKIKKSDYRILKTFKGYMFFKFSTRDSYNFLLIRKDLYEQIKNTLIDTKE